MLKDKLKLNEVKAEFLVIGTRQQLDKVSLDEMTIGHGKVTTVFVDIRLWKTKHQRKRFQNFRQLSCVLRIEIHQSQPLV